MLSVGLPVPSSSPDLVRLVWCSMRSGIYRIVNTVNGHQYIGSSCDVDRRLRKHIRQLEAGQHHSKYLQRAWCLHGRAAFVLEFLWSVEPVRELLWMEEQHALNCLRAEYNARPVANTSLGYRHRAETIEKMRRTHAGRKKTEETRERMKKAARERDGRRVLSLAPDGTRKTYASIAEACEDTGAHQSCVSRVCRRGWGVAAGLHWEYV